MDGGLNQDKINDVPSDLQVDTSQGQNTPSSFVESSAPKIPAGLGASNIGATLQIKKRRQNNWWVWVIGVVFGLGLIGGTIYFVLTQINFNRGKINFTFDPAGVDVVIDNGNFSKSAVASFSINLKAGDHTIVVTREGYLDLEEEFNVATGEASDMKITLESIPAVELLAEVSVVFPQLIRRDELLAFWDDSVKSLRAINTTTKELVNLFSVKISNVRKVDWSNEGVAVLLKLSGIWKLSNMQDNRSVPGQYIPLGESPEQAPALNNGVATWLLDGDRQTSAGLQPVLLNESVRDIVFSPSGSQIIYFYQPANGERSIIGAENTDGRAWTRIVTDIPAENPRLVWLEDDQYLLMLDDAGQPDRLLDILSGELVNVMSDRVSGSLVVGSPEGDRILYVANLGGQTKLAVWKISTGEVEKILDKPVSSFTWKNEDTVIVSLLDNNLWYWDLIKDKQKPVQFTSSFGDFKPQQLLYSALTGKLFILEANRVFNIRA